MAHGSIIQEVRPLLLYWETISHHTHPHSTLNLIYNGEYLLVGAEELQPFRKGRSGYTEKLLTELTLKFQQADVSGTPAQEQRVFLGEALILHFASSFPITVLLGY